MAVLVAIAIPVFTAQLEKAREATDLANVRSAYAEVVAAYLEDDGPHSATVEMKSKTTEDPKTAEVTVAGVSSNDILKGKTSVTVEVDKDGKVKIAGKEAKSSFLSGTK